MVFKATKDNGGVRDPRISTKGRIIRDKPLNRELKDRYLIELLRKLRPGQASAIKRVLDIVKDDSASDQNHIKASALVMSTYTSLIKELYGKDEETDDEESVDALQEEPAVQAKLFSLTMIKNSSVPDKEPDGNS